MFKVLCSIAYGLQSWREMMPALRMSSIYPRCRTEGKWDDSTDGEPAHPALVQLSPCSGFPSRKGSAKRSPPRQGPEAEWSRSWILALPLTVYPCFYTIPELSLTLYTFCLGWCLQHRALLVLIWGQHQQDHLPSKEQKWNWHQDVLI